MRARIVLLTLAVTAIVIVAAAAAYLYSGRYDVAATTPHSSFGRWFLQTLQEQSVQARAEHVLGPPELDAELLAKGSEHFASKCVVCHGAPGVERGELGKGITPTPPDLSHAAEEWTAREIYWIVKHGIKLAGMPAFGPTHSDEDLWALTAFVQQLPDTTPQRYRELTADAAGGSAPR